MATVLVALAVTESSPSQIRVGKETSVPPPATELIAPARNDALKAIAACAKSSVRAKVQDIAALALGGNNRGSAKFGLNRRSSALENASYIGWFRFWAVALEAE